jgi:hypothetical protein
MRVALSLDLDLAKFDQSCFHFSMFRWLELQGNETGILRGCSFLTAVPSGGQEIDCKMQSNPRWAATQIKQQPRRESWRSRS